MKTKDLKMTTRHFAVTCLLSLQLLNIQTAMAFEGGGAIGGGGGDHVTSNGKVEIADVYGSSREEISKFDDNQMLIESSVKARANFLVTMLEGYAPLSVANWQSLRSRFSVGFDALYLSVDEIPEFKECKNRLRLENLPEDAAVNQFACTVGKRTFIVKERFDKFNTHQKALGLIHEALRVISAPDHVIVAVIKGLNLMGKLYDQQAKGNFTQLTEEEKKLILDMSLAGKKFFDNLDGADLAFRAFRKEVLVNDFGAIMFKGQANMTKAILGVGTSFLRVSDGVAISIDETATLINSQFKVKTGKVSIGKNAKLQNVVVVPNDGTRPLVDIQAGVQMKNTSFAQFEGLTVEKDSQLNTVTVNGTYKGFTKVVVAEKSELKNFSILTCFNTSTLKIEGAMDGNGLAGHFIPTWPLTFGSIKNEAELKKFLKSW